MIDTTKRWAEDSEGLFHASSCVIANAGSKVEAHNRVPEDAEFAECCSKYSDDALRK